MERHRALYSDRTPIKPVKGEMDNRFILLLAPIERSQSVTEVSATGASKSISKRTLYSATNQRG